MNDDNAEIYNHAAEMLATIDSSFLDLGRIFATAQADNPELYKMLKTLPALEPRTAYYLMNIWKVYGHLPVEKKVLARVGWTKLQTMSKYVTFDNVNWLLDLAQACTDRQLRDTLTGKKPNKDCRVVLLYLKPAQYARYRKAMIAFGAQPFGRGLAGQEKALMALLKMFMS